MLIFCWYDGFENEKRLKFGGRCHVLSRTNQHQGAAQEKKRQTFWFCCQCCPWLASTTPNMDVPDNHDQTTYDRKTKIVVFYSLSNVFYFISGSKFREDISK